MEIERIIDNLNSGKKEIRLEALEELKKKLDGGLIKEPERQGDINNHIHTTYSFSPYSPTKALWMAYISGLVTAGIVDHDSVSGAKEFIEAGKILNFPVTVGAECRVDFSETPFSGRRINNPDQDSIAYVTINGITRDRIDDVDRYFEPFRRKRNQRNRLMVNRINDIFTPFNMELDFERDVLPLSMAHEGGSITERHILFALGRKMINTFSKGVALVEFLEDKMELDIKSSIGEYLKDSSNIYYEYDLLGVLKSDLIDRIYIEAKEECPDVFDFIGFVKSVGAISAYAYLGDVSDSVTGDKKSMKFEDDYVEELFVFLKRTGFNGITYMPSRNSSEQIGKVKSLCEKLELFQISGEDINSPRQSFICEKMRNSRFDNLVDAAFALIGHEKAAALDGRRAMFSNETLAKYPSLDERIRIYKNYFTEVII